MKTNQRRLAGLAAAVVVVLSLFGLAMTAPKHPVAVIRVQDAAGKPVAGAVVQPEGLRTKPGPYVGGWYGWNALTSGVTNPPVTTDAAGSAVVPYPKYVFERIETGTLCLSVSHPDFVSERPERVVASAPPAGAPWRVRLMDFWGRLRHRRLIAHPEPVVLQPGAVLRIALAPDQPLAPDVKLFAQVSGEPFNFRDFWFYPEPRVIATRRLPAGPHTARAVGLEPDGTAWFSEVFALTAAAGQTNDVVVKLKRGVTLHGELDGKVPRPVRNGRVVAKVTPRGASLQDSPPQWHAWSPVAADGGFVIGSLPAGDLEITALCEGYVSTNGPGQHALRYPQRHVLGTNDLAIVMGMEPTVRLEVSVTDPDGRPLKDVRVTTWPNVRYGEWAATLLMSDCVNTADQLLGRYEPESMWGQRVPDFEGTSDGTGVAVLANLPATVNSLNVEHPEFELPAVNDNAGRKQRRASFTLTAGQTNRLSIQLERRGRSEISHY